MTYSQSNGIILNVIVDIQFLCKKSNSCFNAVDLLCASKDGKSRLKQLKEINKEIKYICKEKLTRETLTKLSTQGTNIRDEVFLLTDLGIALDLLFRLDLKYANEAEKKLLEECIETLVEALEYFVGPMVNSGLMTLDQIIGSFQYGSKIKTQFFHNVYGETREKSTKAWLNHFRDYF